MMIDSLTGPGAADQRSANLEGPQMRMQERMSLGGPAGFREDDISKQGSFLSTKHKSENSLNENSFENFVPIIKRMNSEEVIDDCECHPTKKLKYFDISAPKMLYCSKCVIDLVVDKNFNSAMTNKGSATLNRIPEEEADRRLPE